MMQLSIDGGIHLPIVKFLIHEKLDMGQSGSKRSLLEFYAAPVGLWMMNQNLLILKSKRGKYQILPLIILTCSSAKVRKVCSSLSGV